MKKPRATEAAVCRLVKLGLTKEEISLDLQTSVEWVEELIARRKAREPAQPVIEQNPEETLDEYHARVFPVPRGAMDYQQSDVRTWVAPMIQRVRDFVYQYRHLWQDGTNRFGERFSTHGPMLANVICNQTVWAFLAGATPEDAAEREGLPLGPVLFAWSLFEAGRGNLLYRPVVKPRQAPRSAEREADRKRKAREHARLQYQETARVNALERDAWEARQLGEFYERYCEAASTGVDKQLHRDRYREEYEKAARRVPARSYLENFPKP